MAALKVGTRRLAVFHKQRQSQQVSPVLSTMHSGHSAEGLHTHVSTKNQDDVRRSIPSRTDRQSWITPTRAIDNLENRELTTSRWHEMSHSKSGATSFLSEKMGPQNLMFKNHVLIEIAKIGGTPRKQTQVAMDQYAGWWFQAIINIFLK